MQQYSQRASRGLSGKHSSRFDPLKGVEGSSLPVWDEGAGFQQSARTRRCRARMDRQARGLRTLTRRAPRPLRLSVTQLVALHFRRQQILLSSLLVLSLSLSRFFALSIQAGANGMRALSIFIQALSQCRAQCRAAWVQQPLFTEALQQTGDREKDDLGRA